MGQIQINADNVLSYSIYFCIFPYAQSDQSLCLLLEYSMTVKLLAEHQLEFLSLKGGCTGSSLF